MILVFGKTGQVARELFARAHDARFVGREDADLRYPETCAEVIRASAPEAVINAAAYTAVDAAEEDEETARLVNAEAPGAMAAEAAEQGIPFVHISTDYVFPGTGESAQSPGDPTGPLGVYGRTKLAGEEAVRAAGGPHAILRTSWVFSAQGANFVKTMLRLSRTRDALNVVEDQIGGPTPAGSIAAACLTIAERLKTVPDLSGTYHFSGAPDTSWKGFAEAIFELAEREVAVTGIPTSAYPTPAARPLNSRLDCASTQAAFGIVRPDWREALAQVIETLRAGD